MTNADDLPDLVENEPAFLLDEGIAYVRGWAHAQHAATALKAALADLGQPDRLPHLRADVTITGSGIVELGRVTPQTASLLADALRALAAKNGRSGDGCAA
jgi:hypothetical protein